MSIVLAVAHPAQRSRYRLRRVLTEAVSVMLGVVLLIWSLLPVYNVFLIALDPEKARSNSPAISGPPSHPFRVSLMS
jgi:hypothetical protein